MNVETAINFVSMATAIAKNTACLVPILDLLKKYATKPRRLQIMPNAIYIKTIPINDAIRTPALNEGFGMLSELRVVLVALIDVEVPLFLKSVLISSE